MDFSAVHDPVSFRVRQPLGNGFKEAFFFLEPIEFQRGQEDSGGLSILGDYNGMPGIPQVIQPRSGLRFKSAEGDYIFSELDCLHRLIIDFI